MNVVGNGFLFHRISDWGTKLLPSRFTTAVHIHAEHREASDRISAIRKGLQDNPICQRILCFRAPSFACTATPTRSRCPILVGCSFVKAASSTLQPVLHDLLPDELDDPRVVVAIREIVIPCRETVTLTGLLHVAQLVVIELRSVDTSPVTR